MTIELQNKIKSTKHYYEYLKDNSSWYIILNRNPSFFNQFESYLKDHYHLRITDRVSSAIDNIDLVTNVLNAFK